MFPLNNTWSIKFTVIQSVFHILHPFFSQSCLGITCIKLNNNLKQLDFIPWLRNHEWLFQHLQLLQGQQHSTCALRHETSVLLVCVWYISVLVPPQELLYPVTLTAAVCEFARGDFPSKNIIPSWHEHLRVYEFPLVHFFNHMCAHVHNPFSFLVMYDCSHGKTHEGSSF